MIALVLFAALLGLTSARPQVYLLPSGVPYLHGKENVIPFSTPIHIHDPTAVPIPVAVRVALPEDKVNADEHKTPASTVLTPDVKPIATRQLVFNHGFPIHYAYPHGNIHAVVGGAVATKRVRRQVLGNPAFDRMVIDWAVMNCPTAPIIGGAVGGASGGPLGVLLGVVGAGIGACNFNP